MILVACCAREILLPGTVWVQAGSFRISATHQPMIGKRDGLSWFSQIAACS
jgi:hypothetical protein